MSLTSPLPLSSLHNGATAPNTSAAPAPAAAAASSTVMPASEGVASNHHIFIVTGPAGCGKSTLAKFLTARYGFVYIEGDDFHPQANVDKMAANIPLDDADRWDWLILLRDQALKNLDQGATGVVISCSALKRKYRDVLRTARLYGEDPNMTVHFVYLRADLETLLARVGARKDHYMKDAMVMSQLAALEEPDENETRKLRDVAIIDVKGTVLEVQNMASQAVDLILAKGGKRITSAKQAASRI